MKKPEEQEDADWEYGDVWKQGSPDQAPGDERSEFVEVLRMDSGQGYDDSGMIDLIGYLGSHGIGATYDSFSIGLEGAAIKTYTLKVEAGKEAEALNLLRERSP